MRIGKKGIALLLALMLMLTGQAAFAAESEITAAVNDTAAYIYKTVKNPQVDSVGGEWAIIGLARSGYNIPTAYYENYYRTVEAYVKAAEGKLHDKKYTEYSRVILALTAAGYNPTDVAGYDLTKALGDFQKTVWQGINGPVFALIALDSLNYTMPQNTEADSRASRDLYIDEIISRQLPDGGFSLNGASKDTGTGDYRSDPDITAMVLQALAKYQYRNDVKKITEEALLCLSKLQNNRGGYESRNGDNVESTAQVIIALTELGISLNDQRFVKNGNSLQDNLLGYYVKGKGFRHDLNSEEDNQMATEQAFCALVAAQRAGEGKSTLYRMGDRVESIGTPKEDAGTGLAGKHGDVKVMALTYPGKTFDDITGHKAQASIEKLAQRGIISGKSEKSFDADATMTRAEFASIVVRSLGFSGKALDIFSDVPANSWYHSPVGTAYSYGIVAGTSPTTFNPMGTISREEAAAMVARAAKLAGFETALADIEVRDTLAQFGDYISVADWARSSLAFCYQADILSQEDLDILPKLAIKRYEVAQMLFKMLEGANLL